MCVSKRKCVCVPVSPQSKVGLLLGGTRGSLFPPPVGDQYKSYT